MVTYMETKFCPRCSTEKVISEFYVNKARSDGLSGYCAPCQRVAEDERRARLRGRVLQHLGDKCVRCGFDDVRALCIDHVNGDGAEERALYGTNTGFMNKVLADTEGRYQLLCANCNHIKRIEEGEHKGKRVYVRTEPTERKVGVGRWGPEVNAKRAEAARQRGADPVARQQKADKMRQTASGRRLVVGPDGKKHWSYPSDPV